MLDYRMFNLAVVFFAAYLLISLTMVQATNINIYVAGISFGTVEYKPEKLVKREIRIEKTDPFWNSANVFMNISVREGEMKAAYIYKCRGLQPHECIKSGFYDSFIPENGLWFAKNYQWSELADTSVPPSPENPQKAKIIMLIELETETGERWVGFFDEIKRTDFSFPEPWLFNYSLNEAELHVNMDYATQIESFVQGKEMIPFNPEWTEKIVFSGTEKAYEFQAESPPGFQADDVYNHSTNTITNISKEYSFALPYTDGIVYNPIVLNLNPSFTCGNGQCETELGESSANCCYDCACTAGYYCDASSPCKRIDGITLDLYGKQNTHITSCSESHVVNITLRLNNPPFGMQFIGKQYILAGQTYTAACEGGPSVYICHIPVPADPKCDEGTYNIGPNYIIFNITFPDGPRNPIKKDLVVQFPNITVASWECGNNMCETELGESSANCCYDCACTAGYYCDWYDGSGTCKPEVTDSNLLISFVNPRVFNSSLQGQEHFNLIAQILNRPDSLVSNPEASCAIDCRYNLTSICTAACSISCAEEAGGPNPNIYNSSCEISFDILNYNQSRNYILYPEMNYIISYKNGSASITKTLTGSIDTITLGPHRCGDGECTPDESMETCCYDCACTAGYYCYTENPGYPGLYDECRNESGISMQITTNSPTVFSDSSAEHTINITINISNKPGGTVIEGKICKLGGLENGVACFLSCSDDVSSSPENYVMNCNITVPAINYLTSPFYNNQTKKLEFSSNSIRISIRFNDGSRGYATKELNGEFDDVVITPEFYCGNHVCEDSLETPETASNCCVDCACKQDPLFGSEYFCLISSENPGGTCIHMTDIGLVIDDPDTAKCTISNIGDGCLFMHAVNFNAEIVNAPHDVQIISSYYTYDGIDYALTCMQDSMNHTNYSCSFVIPHPEGPQEGSMVKNVDVNFVVRYTDGNELITQNISGSFSLYIKMEKTSDVRTCEAQLNEIEEDIKEIKDLKDFVKGFVNVFLGIASFFAPFCALEIATGGLLLWFGVASCVWAAVASCMASCISATIIPLIDDTLEEAEGMKANIESRCQATDLDSLNSGIIGMFDKSERISTLVSGVTCAVCFIAAIFL